LAPSINKDRLLLILGKNPYDSNRSCKNRRPLGAK
jgi:hypothetical protein